MADSDESNALRVVKWVTERAIEGVPPLSSAESLAQEYLIDSSYPDDEERIESLINWETSKNFTTGFVTGLGGVLTLPLTIPAGLGASWVVQARMSAAIARIAGHDIGSDRVRTFVALSLLGDAAKEIVKDVGVKAGTKFANALIQKIPGEVLKEINKKVGFRLVTKAGEKGVVNLTKVVPVIGGLVGGTVDAAACRAVGKTAKRLFYGQGTN